MSQLSEQLVRIHKRRLDATFGVTGVYGRGIEVRDGLVGVPRLPSIGSQELGESGLLTAKELDWMFTADELVLDGLRIEPMKGDWWRYRRSDGKYATYTVINDQTGRASFPSDHLGVLIRVHTELSKVEEPPQ